MSTKETVLYSSAVFVFDKEKNLVLGVSRKNNHNLFGFPGGKLDFGETFWEAGVRELKEETGLDATIMRYMHDMLHSNERMHYHCCVFAAEVVGEIYTKEKGVVAWLPPKILANGPFGDLSRKTFDIMNVKY